MKISVDIKLDPEFLKTVQEAARQAMRDTVVAVHNQSAKNSPKKTGHNMRSLASEVSGMGTVQEGADAEVEKIVDDSKIEGAVYSTSGYGGFLETGTVKMAARPYMKPALDMEFTQEKFVERIKRYLK